MNLWYKSFSNGWFSTVLATLMGFHCNNFGTHLIHDAWLRAGWWLVGWYTSQNTKGMIIMNCYKNGNVINHGGNHSNKTRKLQGNVWRVQGEHKIRWELVGSPSGSSLGSRLVLTFSNKMPGCHEWWSYHISWYLLISYLICHFITLSHC